MPLLATNHSPSDQARELRALVAQRARCADDLPREIRSCRSITVTSGKGGVGKSVVALNLAMAFAQRGDSVCLVDASPSVGHLELLCGQSGYWNLAHVAAGSRRLEDIVLDGPGGVRIVPGASCLLDDEDVPAHLLRQLADLERHHDWLIVDTAGGSSGRANPFVHTADRALIVTTPEPTALAEAYAALKGLSVVDDFVASVLVNRADSERQAIQILDRLRQTARSFLRTDFDRLGFVSEDATLRQSIATRRPQFGTTSNGTTQQAFTRISERLSQAVTPREPTGYFQRVLRSPATLRRDRSLAAT